jgi:hypothetical protein
MTPQREPQLKDPKLYDELRGEGNSKEKSARISNAAAAQGRSKIARKGGESGSYEDWTVAALKRRAKELGLKNYSNKKKSHLVDALRDH